MPIRSATFAGNLALKRFATRAPIVFEPTRLTAKSTKKSRIRSFGLARRSKLRLKEILAMKTQMVSTELQFKNVLYATDFRRDAELALPYALSVARKYDSKVYVVHVVDVSPFSVPGPTGAMRAVVAQAIREAKEASLELSSVFG